VTGTDEFDIPAYFSPVGVKIYVAAPGLNIQSTTIGDTYGVLSGTSQAAPHITGIAALYLASGIQDLNNNGFVNDEIIKKIKDYAIDLGDPGFDNNTGYGLANAAPCPDYLGLTCSSGIGACEASGTYICTENGSGTECDAVIGLPGLEGPKNNPTCNDSIDNDCDGKTDLNDSGCNYCPDADSDGYAVCDDECTSIENFTCGGSNGSMPCGDCNDNDASINPDASEVCDTIDNDCNGIIDMDNETCRPVCPDNDADGFAECDITCKQKVITSCGSSSLQPCDD
jgi:hypothetical protein